MGRKSFTLIELIMVMLILGVLSVGGAALMTFFIQQGFFVPNQLNAEMLTADAIDLMIEGDDQAKGLRFARSISNARRYRIDFVNQDNQQIIYRLRQNQNRFTRSIDGGPQETIPYYTPSSGITITGPNNRVFSYFDGNENQINNNPAAVRRVALTIAIQTGTGAFEESEGQTELSSSVAIKPL